MRDALAAVFVAAVSGDAPAQSRVRALADWATGVDAVSGHAAPDAASVRARLAAIMTEAGDPLFDETGCVAAHYSARAPYIVDRARRMDAALGWLIGDGHVGHVLEAARAAWDAGLFFEVHEILEPAWLSAEEPRKTGLQSLILAGVALHHLTNANLAGARSLLRRAVGHIALDPRASGCDLAELGRGLAALSEALDAGRITSAAEVEDLPRF